MILYTVGDSFTYGDELSDPKKDSWPAVLSDKLSMSLINEGRSGVGNEYIVKKTIQAVSKYRPSLVIIAWTSCGRIEFADQYGVYDIWPGCSSRAFSEDRSSKLEYRHELIKYVNQHNNDMHEYRRWLRNVILLQSFLQNQSIDYIMCNVFDNQHRFEKYYKDNQEYYELIDHTRFLGWPKDGMVEWAHRTPKGPGGHPLEEGHKKIAEEIYEACNTAR